ncbi:MAG: hypothetical protein ABWZ87_08945, partial [Aeromicrobium sp.]
DWKIGDLRLENAGAEIYATTEVEVQPTRYRENEKSEETAGPIETASIAFAVTGPGGERTVTQLALGDQ